MTPPLSVVVVAYDSAATIERCLRSVSDQWSEAETIVVDNGSTDGTIAIAERAHAKVLSGHGNVGFGAGCNLGVAHATSELVLFLNPDAWIAPGTAPPWVARDDGPFGLRAADEPSALRADPPWPVELLSAVAISLLLPSEINAWRVAARPGRRAWASGSAMLVDRQEICGLGGFDERYFLYYEDRDLSRRYVSAGLPVMVQPGLHAGHVGGLSTGTDVVRQMAWKFLGLLQFVAIWDGPEAASKAAKSTVGSARAVEHAGRFAHPVLGPRAARKRRQASALLQRLRVELTADDDHYPQAKRALAPLLAD